MLKQGSLNLGRGIHTTYIQMYDYYSYSVIYQIQCCMAFLCFHINMHSYCVFLFYLGMCAFASRSFSEDRGRPFGQWGLLGLSCGMMLWLQPSFPPWAPSLSFSFSLAPSFSFARPLCSARRMSKCFLRPGTARRWVKEWVCDEKQRKKVNFNSINLLLWANKHLVL